MHDPVDTWERHLGPAGDAGAVVGDLGAGSLAEAFHATAMDAPDALALLIDGERLTHGELDRRAAATASRLRDAGLGAGDRVLLSGGNSAAFVIAYLAVLRLGGVVVLAGAALTTPELSHIAAGSGAAAGLSAGPTLSRVRELSGLRRVFDLEDLTAQAAGGSEVPPAAVRADATALLAFTSGTTGRPKGVPLTHANLLSSIRAAMLAWRWSAQDVLVHALPLTHQHGLGGVHATLLAGSAAVIHPTLDPAVLFASIAAERATVLFGVPAAYERLTAWEGSADADLGSLRLLVSGSAPLSPALAHRIERRFGQVPLERYGTTESGLDVSNPYDGPRRIGSVGVALPGVEIAVVDGGGEPVPVGGEGEIVMRGPQVFAGYEGDPEATAEAFFEGGWFRSGDIGRFDPADGYLVITGRAKELIITGGLNVYPREVELALEEEPTVARAAVAGVPSERWGEEVVAFVVPAPGAEVDPGAVMASVRGRLAPYKCPKRVVVLDELPVNSMGKLVRAELARFAAALDGYRAATRHAAELIESASRSARV